MDDFFFGKLTGVVLLSAALSVLGAWLLAWRFRRAMRALMSRPGLPVGEAPAPSLALATPSVPTIPSAADDRRASLHMAALVIAVSVLVALTGAVLWTRIDGRDPVTPLGALARGIFYLWPVIPVLGLLRRWSLARMVATLLLWCLVVLPFLIWRAPESATVAGMAKLLAWEIGPTFVLVGFLCMGNASRAIAPWLLAPLFVLLWAAFTGLDFLTRMVRPDWAGFDEAAASLNAVDRLVGYNPLVQGALVVLIFLLFMAVPCALAWRPLKWLTRQLAAAYSRQWLSEVPVLLTTVWGLSLLHKAIAIGNAAMLLPLLWIPVAMLLVRALRRPADRVPTLLVLRVFQRDRAMRLLFDTLIERWRLCGNTLLIAGTDLLERTLGADDIFTFLHGRLAERFIFAADQIPARVAAFKLAPDVEGRYRINECYCHDSTWRETLAALLARSDVALMDLRSFQRRNEGCSFELGELARAPHLTRVVLLTDGQTDLAAARAAAAAAPAGRFLWLDATDVDRARRRQVLDALFAAAST
jgi:hypothetical protein